MNDSSDPFDEIRSRMNNPPEKWTPRGVPDGVDVDKCLTDPAVDGFVESIEEQADDYDGHKLVVIRREDATRLSIRGYGAILQSFFAKVEVGDMIAIIYEGEATPKTQGYSDYPVYRVERIPAPREANGDNPPGEPGLAVPDA